MNGNSTADFSLLSNGADRVTVTLSDDNEDDDPPLVLRLPHESQEVTRTVPAKPQRRSAANNIAVRLNQAKREEKLISSELKKRAHSIDITVRHGEVTGELEEAKKMRIDGEDMLGNHADNDGECI